MQGNRPHRLDTPIQFVKGVGPHYAELFLKMNVETVRDVFFYLPRTYEDRRVVTPMARLVSGMRSICVGEVKSVRNKKGRYGKSIQEVLVADVTGYLTLQWFHAGAWLLDAFQVGARVIVAGEMKVYRGAMVMVHPDFEILDDDRSQDSLHFNRIVPIYPETEDLKQKRIRRILDHALGSYLDSVEEVLPKEVLNKHGLPSLVDAFRFVHQPPDDADMSELLKMRSVWQQRLIFDEFFLLLSSLAVRRRDVSRKPGIPMDVAAEDVRGVLKGLPFQLTGAQRKSLRDVWEDMKKPSPMNRLVQGDVGSGKTVVALVAASIAAIAGQQSALMAPTEILAEQHFKSTMNLAVALRLRTALLTSSVKGKDRQSVLDDLRSGETDLLIGTHALIQEDVEFQSLGLAVVDEQHRFGVLQRETLRKKGKRPDLLVMTATPIPRSLALTLYGDLDLSVIDEMPPGRQEIKTKLFSLKQRQKVYGEIAKELKKGRQVYVVYPLVEESEKLDVKDAVSMHGHLSKEFKGFTVGLLHGRMKPAEKEAMMKSFRKGKTHVLVATTVIEVGVDVANATMMVIEHAERFGLTQLHQLRGRVGRGEHQSKCLLVADLMATEDSKKRLAVMEQTTDGFRIAEEDLAIRGPGEFLGTRQSGMPELRVANLGRDMSILSEARDSAFALVSSSEEKAGAQLQQLLAEAYRRWGDVIFMKTTN